MVLLSGVFNETPINRQEINQKILDIEDKQRTNPLPWKGQFSPQFIEALIEKYADKNSIIFDPFLGSGTVLYEAGRCGIEIKDAIEKAETVEPSLYYNPEQSRKQIDEF